MSRKTNPRRIPRTQADVDEAWERGVHDGVTYSTAMFMNVLCDKFNGRDYVPDVWKEIMKLSESMLEKRVSIPDIKRILKEEYDIEV